MSTPVVRANYAVVDFSKPSTDRRLTIYSTTGSVLFKTYVAHGVGSGRGIYAERFSNIPNSRMSSLGHYRIGEAYYGKNGLSYRLYGLDRTNNNAYRRAVVLHSATYIGYGHTGTSWGCPAIPTQDFHKVMTLLKKGDSLYIHN